MVRFLKWFFPISLAVLIVVVASAYWYVTPQRLKEIVQPRLSSVLGQRGDCLIILEWGLSDGVVISRFAGGRSGWIRFPSWLRSGYRCLCRGGSCCRLLA